MKYIAYLLLITFSFSAFGEEAVFLKKGQSSPYDGFLIDREKAERYRLLNEDLATCVKIDSLRIQETEILQKRVDNLNVEINNMSSRLVSQKDTSFWTSVGMFILGAATASLVAYGASRSVK